MISNPQMIINAILSQANATNTKHILNWLTCPPSKQPYILLKKSDLQNMHKEKISNTIPPSVSTTTALIDVLSGEIPPPTDETTTENISYPVEAVVHTNFLPLLKGTT